ncbi:MAG TPA: LacI family DNA-binding transcriptional regulator [Gaiellales bacterium]|jgi:LacI family transcriptional regulator
MSQRQVTMRDVARAAGVHPGTVSRVLNPRTRPLVNPATADRVEQVAREMGYSLNPIARGLKTRRSFSVGVLIPDLTNPLFPPIIRGIERVLDAAGYTALVASTDGEPARERLRLEALIARQVDGFVIATAERRHPVVADAIASELAVVLVNRTIEGEGVFAVVPDDRRGSAMAVDHLAALGHTRIAHIAGPQQTTTGLLRYRGFFEAIEDAGLAPDRGLIAQGEAFTIVAGAKAARELLATADPPTGIVAANDLLALGAYTALAEAGLDCPGDVSVVGFNDMPFADRFAPPLTTVHIPHGHIGARAAELLLERIEDPAATPQTLVFEPTLRVRGSTAAPARRRRPAGSGATAARGSRAAAPRP